MNDPWAFGMGELIAVVTGVAGIAVAVWICFVGYYVLVLEKDESCRDIRERHLERLDVDGWARYRDALRRRLTWIDRFFGYEADDGTRSLFRRPWTRCLSLAFVYPTVFLLVGYAATGRATLAGQPLVDTGADVWPRLAVIAAALGLGLFWFAFARFDWDEKAADLAVRALSRAVPSPAWRKGLHARTRLLAFAFAFAFAVAFAGAFAGAVAFAGAGAVAGAVAFAGAGAGAGAGAVILILGGSNPVSILFFAVFMLFPVANSLLDWASLTVTRRLMGGWVRGHGGPGAKVFGYAWGTVWDLAFALGFLCLLAALFMAEFELLDALLGAWLYQPTRLADGWIAQMDDFRRDPFGAGWMITLMLFSTLLPTVAHVAAGTGALVKLPNWGRAYVVAALADGPPPAWRRPRVAMAITVPWLAPVTVWSLIALLLMRVIPLAWLPASWVGEDASGGLLFWLPYKVSEWVWAWLAGG